MFSNFMAHVSVFERGIIAQLNGKMILSLNYLTSTMPFSRMQFNHCVFSSVNFVINTWH